jgi:hypothetical protein
MLKADLKTVAVVAALLLRTVAVDAARQVTLHVWPAVSSAPATLLIYVSVVPHADNRALRIVANSEEYARASEVTLHGENSPNVTTFQYRDLPPGNYDVRAVLIGPNGQTRDTVWCAVIVQ